MAISGSVNSQLSTSDRQLVQLVLREVGPSIDFSFSFSDGTSAGQANLAWAETRTIPGGGSEDLDLTALANFKAATIGFASIIVVGLKNNSTTNTCQAKTDITNGWQTCLNGTLTLRPSTTANPSYIVLTQADATGSVVTNNTGDLLRIVGTAGQTYSILIIGRSI